MDEKRKDEPFKLLFVCAWWLFVKEWAHWEVCEMGVAQLFAAYDDREPRQMF